MAFLCHVKTAVPGPDEYLKKMDHAGQGLGIGTESVLYNVRRQNVTAITGSLYNLW